MEGIQFLNDTFYDSLVKKGTIKSSTKAEVCIRISEIFDGVFVIMLEISPWVSRLVFRGKWDRHRKAIIA